MKEGVGETFLQGRFCAKNLVSPDRRLDSSTIHIPECIFSILHGYEYAQPLCVVVGVPFAEVTKQLSVDAAERLSAVL
jgi:hypothetical protein